MAASQGQKSKRRRWFQWSLRSLLVWMFVFAIGLGWLVRAREKVRMRRETIEFYKSIRPIAYFEFDKKQPPKWLSWLLNDNSRRGDVVGLSMNSIRTQDWHLAHLSGLPELRELDLSRTSITDDGLAHLSGLPELRELDLTGTSIRGDGLIHLLGLTELRRLVLDRSSIRDDGLIHLSRLGKLEVLDLWRTDVGDSGLSHICGIKSLRTIILGSTRVTRSGVKKLKEANPKLKVLL